MTNVSLLLIDDDMRFRQRMALALRDRDVSVLEAGSPSEALAQLAIAQVDTVVTDLRMPEVSGLQFVRELREQLPGVRIVVLTGFGTIATAVEAMRLGVTTYLVKPCNADQLLAAITGEEDPPDEETLAGQTPSLAKVEREHIERVLTECGGNISKASRVLGIHRRCAQFPVQKFHIISVQM
jgi:two-component system response regulator RegA